MADMDPRTGKLGSLMIRCTCGYSATWPRPAIIAKVGAYMRPAQLRMGLKCSACGAKGPPKVTIHPTRY
jgi:hypothetical protein